MNKRRKVIIFLLVIFTLVCSIGYLIFRKDKVHTLSETVWYCDDQSVLVFPNDESFVWYKDADFNNAEDYNAGIYKLYTGKEAYKLISSLYSNDEEKPTYNKDNALLILFSTNNESEEVETRYYYGFKYEDKMTYVDLLSLNQYDFYTSIESLVS